MAAPTLTLLNHNLLTSADANTGWFDLVTADTDLKKEGTGAMSGILRANGEEAYYTAGAAVSGTGKTIRGWINTTNLPYMQPESLNGYQLLAYDGTTTEYKVIFGSDTYFGGWFNYIWTMADFTTLTLANTIRWGVRANHHTSGRNVVNAWMDAIRYLDGYSMTGGSSGDKIRLSNIEVADRGTPTLTGYGVLTVVSGIYFCTGKMQFGTGATTTYFEMDGQVLVFENRNVSAGLYTLTGIGTGTNIVIKNSVIQSSGTTDATRFTLIFNDADLAALEFITNLVVRAGAVSFKSGQTVTGNTFDNCGQITAGGANLTNSLIKNYAGVADSSALIWNVAANPNGLLDDSTFSKGAAATHAIEFGLNAPTTMTLTNVNFSAYNAENGQPDSAIHIKLTTGTVTIYISGGDSPSYKSDGAIVNIVAGTVTFTLTAQTADGSYLQDAKAFVKASDGTGPFPYKDSVTIVNSGTIATVTHTAHGLATNDKVFIEGASLAANRGVFSITVTDANTYTYTMSSTPGSSPTGTITSTFVVVKGLTDVNGQISMTRVFPSNQPYTGWARKASGSPHYQEGLVSGLISNAIGAAPTALMVLDE